MCYSSNRRLLTANSVRRWRSKPRVYLENENSDRQWLHSCQPLEMKACLMWLRGHFKGAVRLHCNEQGNKENLRGQRTWGFGLEVHFSSCEMRSHWKILSTGMTKSDLYNEQLTIPIERVKSFCLSVCSIDNRLWGAKGSNENQLKAIVFSNSWCNWSQVYWQFYMLLSLVI